MWFRLKWVNGVLYNYLLKVHPTKRFFNIALLLNFKKPLYRIKIPSVEHELSPFHVRHTCKSLLKHVCRLSVTAQHFLFTSSAQAREFQKWWNSNSTSRSILYRAHVVGGYKIPTSWLYAGFSSLVDRYEVINKVQ